MKTFKITVLHEEPIDRLTLSQIRGGSSCTCNDGSSFSCICNGISASYKCTCNSSSSFLCSKNQEPIEPME